MTPCCTKWSGGASRRLPLFCPRMCFLFGGTPELSPYTHSIAKSHCEVVHCNVRNSDEIHYAAAPVFRRNTSP
ncbi:hypothetical protein ALC62_14102 [Cyphomyrmex costatus]|uniref:Uncharacterized protein n=1 Tax=Cyphomyrmex costatus TaxID=456900 RepID=A0A195C2X7_9HYME|nr:hypothetical protein ALC62_14102 [Cyphomyrmex costatus]